MLTAILSLGVIFSGQNVLAQVGMGPLNINLISSTKCDGDQGYVSVEVVSLDEDKKGFNFDINIDFPMDESIAYKVRVDKIQNGQIQEGVFKHDGDYACRDFEQYLGDLWRNIVDESGNRPGCPREPGHYHIDNLPLKEEDLGLKTYLYGRFLLNLEMSKNGEKLFCHVIEFTNTRPGESA